MHEKNKTRCLLFQKDVNCSRRAQCKEYKKPQEIKIGSELNIDHRTSRARNSSERGFDVLRCKV